MPDGAIEELPGPTFLTLPADFRAEVAAYERGAEVGVWEGPRYRMTWRALGRGPLLVLVPGISATYRVFALTLNRLAGDFQTVIYDYPGAHPHDRACLGWSEPRGVRRSYGRNRSGEDEGTRQELARKAFNEHGQRGTQEARGRR